MTNSANDQFFSIGEQLRSLDEEEAIALASSFIDHNCSEIDAEYLKLVISAAGTDSLELTSDYAARGSPAAQAVLGAAKLYGKVLDKDISQGLFWLRRAHNNGNWKASIMLCGAYLAGDGVKRDARKAVEYIVGPANAGDAAAQYIYANLLIDGDGTEQNEEEGVFWLRRAAERGYERAIQMLLENDIPLIEE